jgi:hypothetical protein
MMTKQKSFKQRVRARMAKTGESYTAARHMLIADGDQPDVTPASFEHPLPEDTVTRATGSGWQQWFTRLDEWGAAARSHTEMARWLAAEQGVSSWWAQSITVAYEQARGLRAPGQQANGWSVGASKTIPVPVERLFAAFNDEALRERWLPAAQMRLRTATAPKSARYDWEDGSTRLAITFSPMTQAKSNVAIQHERLPDAETAEEMKTWWRQRVSDLKRLLEDGVVETR